MSYCLRFFSVVLLGGLLHGCSTPETAMPKLKQYLSPECLELMTKPGLNGYQYISQHPAGRGVFAIASQGGKQVCAYSTTREGARDWNSIEVLALGRCEDARKDAGMTETCKVFARGFDITYDDKKKHGME